MRYIDLHTHNRTQVVDVIKLVNINIALDEVPVDGYCSVGIHPWHLDEKTVADRLEDLSVIAKKEHVLAIGECGLDKLCGKDWRLQETCFRSQIALANSLNKPMIIHCVRAFHEVTQLLGEEQNISPVIFHGFNRTIEMAHRLIDSGYYLSFGSQLKNKSLAKVFESIPVEFLFLETDGSELDISSVYTIAASIKKLDVQSLSKCIESNFNHVFRHRTFANDE